MSRRFQRDAEGRGLLDARRQARSHQDGIKVRACYSTSLKEMKCSKWSLFEKFIPEGNEETDGPSKEGAMMDGGAMAQLGALMIHQEREEVSAATAGCRSGKIVRS